MEELNVLYAQYGKLLVDKEVIEAKILHVKKKLVAAINEAGKPAPAEEASSSEQAPEENK